MDACTASKEHRIAAMVIVTRSEHRRRARGSIFELVREVFKLGTLPT